MALADIYGTEKLARALADALHYQAFASEYLTNILEQRERRLPEPGPLHLTRKQDLLELQLPAPDLSIYSATGATGGTGAQPPTGDLADESQT